MPFNELAHLKRIAIMGHAARGWCAAPRAAFCHPRSGGRCSRPRGACSALLGAWLVSGKACLFAFGPRTLCLASFGQSAIHYLAGNHLLSSNKTRVIEFYHNTFEAKFLAWVNQELWHPNSRPQT